MGLSIFSLHFVILRNRSNGMPGRKDSPKCFTGDVIVPYFTTGPAVTALFVENPEESVGTRTTWCEIGKMRLDNRRRSASNIDHLSPRDTFSVRVGRYYTMRRCPRQFRVHATPINRPAPTDVYRLRRRKFSDRRASEMPVSRPNNCRNRRLTINPF